MTTEALISNIMKDLKTRGKFKGPDEVDKFFEESLYAVMYHSIKSACDNILSELKSKVSQ